jgi:hypothetical protein
MTDDAAANNMGREEALAKVGQILALSNELKECGYRDLESRAEEIGAMAHWMLYDVHDMR